MKTFVTVLMATVFLTSPTVMAQPGDFGHAKRGKMMGKRLKERMKSLRSETLRYDVGLSDADAGKVIVLLNELDPAREALMKKKRGARMSLRKLLKADSNDQAAYRRAITQLVEVNTKMLALRRTQMESVGTILTPKQQAKFFIATKRLKRQMMHKMNKMRKGQGGGDHGGHFGGPEACGGPMGPGACVL